MPASGLSDLVAQAYEAACDTGSMSGFVENTAEYFDAQQSAITFCPIDNPDIFLPITHGISADEIRALFADRNRPGTIFAALAQTPAGRTIAFDGHHRPDEFQNLPARRRADVRIASINVLAGVVAADEHHRCNLVLFRDKTHGDFSPSEHEALQKLMGYLRRAIHLQKRFMKVFTEHRTAISVLENAPRCIMILGRTARVTYHNQAARQLFARDDGLRLVNDLFTVDDTDASKEVQEFLDLARNSDAPDLNTQRLMIVVPRRSGGAPYKLIMYKLPFDRQQAALDDEQSLAVALVYDPSNLSHLHEGLLHSFYSLTRAEAALAQALYDGRSLPEASVDLGISVNTTRTQLRSIFRKVGVHSQAALLQEFAKNFIHA